MEPGTSPPASPSLPLLVVRAGGALCALRVSDVVETMRPLPLRAIEGAEPWVLGAALVRGEVVPVVALGALLLGDGAAPRRFVVVRAGGRAVALAVDEVREVRHLPVDERGLPPLLDGGPGQRGVVERLTQLDEELLLVLRAARLVPDALAAAPAGPTGAPE